MGNTGLTWILTLLKLPRRKAEEQSRQKQSQASNFHKFIYEPINTKLSVKLFHSISEWQSFLFIHLLTRQVMSKVGIYFICKYMFCLRSRTHLVRTSTNYGLGTILYEFQKAYFHFRIFQFFSAYFHVSRVFQFYCFFAISNTFHYNTA